MKKSLCVLYQGRSLKIGATNKIDKYERDRILTFIYHVTKKFIYSDVIFYNVAIMFAMAWKEKAYSMASTTILAFVLFCRTNVSIIDRSYQSLLKHNSKGPNSNSGYRFSYMNFTYILILLITQKINLNPKNDDIYFSCFQELHALLTKIDLKWFFCDINNSSWNFCPHERDKK